MDGHLDRTEEHPPQHRQQGELEQHDPAEVSEQGPVVHDRSGIKMCARCGTLQVLVLTGFCGPHGQGGVALDDKIGSRGIVDGSCCHRLAAASAMAHDLPARPPPRLDVPAELVSFIEGLPEPHILFDRQYRIVAANAAYRGAFAPRGTVIGRTCYEVSHHFSVPCDQAGESCPLALSRRSGQRERVLHLHHTPQGEAYVNIELVPLRDAQGEPAFFIEKMEALPLARAQPARQGLIGSAPAFRDMLGLVARVAPSEASVLLLGESGTGKELVARAVHEASARANKPWVVVDCASLPESLFESELFGHEKGPSPGPTWPMWAWWRRPAAAPCSWTRWATSRCPCRSSCCACWRAAPTAGWAAPSCATPTCAWSATHRDLAAMVAQGRFREDLYYRLSTFPIALPPLRERLGDLPLLANALLERLAPAGR
jgi:PAS domain-containing protein